MSAATSSFSFPHAMRIPQARVMSAEEQQAIVLSILLEALNRIDRLEKFIGVDQLPDLEVQP